MEQLPVAVIGAGIIGRTHIATLAKTERARLAAIVDPADSARALAAELGVPHFSDVASLINAGVASGAVVATPNETHVPLGQQLLQAGLPVLLEKPVATTIEEGLVLDRAMRDSGLPVLVGHHRRHNAKIKAAKAAIDSGAIGDLVTATVNVTLAKPAPYFDVPWRVLPGHGGPLLINLTHEIDLLRHFFGEVSAVTALVSNSRRKLGVEDTAAAILEFARGGIATCTITDAGCGPWAWDVSAGENPARFPAHDIAAHIYSGSAAGLSMPDMIVWDYDGSPDWTKEMRKSRLPYEDGDPYIAQLDHFAAVIRGETEPLCTCRDGLLNMQVTDAIKQSAKSSRRVELDAIF